MAPISLDKHSPFNLDSSIMDNPSIMSNATTFDQIRMQGGEPQKQDKQYNSLVWLEAIDTGPEFKPDIRPRPKRKAFLNAEKSMVYRVQKKRGLKKADADGKKMALEEAVFWAVVEPEDTEITEDFIKATGKPFEERSIREHEVINVYWRSGYSMDPVLGFENSEVTQRHLESRMYGMTLWSGNITPLTKTKRRALHYADDKQSKSFMSLRRKMSLSDQEY
ncbi:uncharacterized protein RCO7_11016 [Rhynchosporium graminicola]|uniref:Uncharacterized protein n=1 Tax=Rhynchosporium graminicola TaxID=2792576 RepID=A0A1E1LKF1_9HELO|nr:uncharacterized protein RCO7_11016 [Rhynchosporium commune]